MGPPAKGNEAGDKGPTKILRANGIREFAF